MSVFPERIIIRKIVRAAGERIYRAVIGAAIRGRGWLRFRLPGVRSTWGTGRRHPRVRKNLRLPSLGWCYLSLRILNIHKGLLFCFFIGCPDINKIMPESVQNRPGRYRPLNHSGVPPPAGSAGQDQAAFCDRKSYFVRNDTAFKFGQELCGKHIGQNCRLKARSIGIDQEKQRIFT